MYQSEFVVHKWPTINDTVGIILTMQNCFSIIIVMSDVHHLNITYLLTKEVKNRKSILTNTYLKAIQYMIFNIFLNHNVLYCIIF